MGLLKYLLVTVCLSWQIGSALSEASSCYSGIKDACGDGLQELDSAAQKLCTAEWGAFPRLTDDTNTLISVHLTHSMQYLLQASHFNEWNINRPGFHAYFSKLSDEEWDSGIALMTHMIKRGGRLVETHFKVNIQEKWQNRQSELEALSAALDMEKSISNRALHLAHAAVSVHKVAANESISATTKKPITGDAPTDMPIAQRDPEFAYFLSERLNHQTVLRIKHLSNYVNMLAQVLKSGVDKAYALFTFDHQILK